LRSPMTALLMSPAVDDGSAMSIKRGPGDGMEAAIGEYFRVRFPDNWSVAERYDFNWQALKKDADPFDTFKYP
jgi:hypothetical protein